jgi:hypothetical protein
VIGLSSPLSHTKRCKMQLQLYSQRTAHNYLTSGFNNIHLKCAQQTCMDTRTNTKYRKVWQLIYSGYQDLQHHLLIPDRFLNRVSDPTCTATARTCQQDCHYCSLLRLSEATTIIILSAHLKVTFMANILVSCVNCTIHSLHCAVKQFFTLCAYKYYDNNIMFQLLTL